MWRFLRRNLADKKPYGRINLKELNGSERKDNFCHIEIGMTKEEACPGVPDAACAVIILDCGLLKGGRESMVNLKIDIRSMSPFPREQQ